MILDTNVYSRLVVDPEVVSVLGVEKRAALPLPVIAELRSGFLGGGKPIENELKLAKFLNRNNTTVLMPTDVTTRMYAECQQFAKSKGRILSNNDIWIAALAREDGDVLVTYDKDFAVFQELFGDNLKILV